MSRPIQPSLERATLGLRIPLSGASSRNGSSRLHAKRNGEDRTTISLHWRWLRHAQKCQVWSLYLGDGLKETKFKAARKIRVHPM